MKIILDEAVATTESTAKWKLNKLLNFACEGRHVLVSDPPSALEQCLNSFTQTARTEYKQLIDLSVRAAATLPANVPTIRIQSGGSTKWDDPVSILSLDEALALLSEPLAILVENDTADWNFLIGIMRPSERLRMLAAVKNGWAVPLHGGGSTITNKMESRAQVAHQRHRTFVVFDSDRRHPDELDRSWAPTPPEGCQGFDTERTAILYFPRQHWMLKRRFIESYMPAKELRKAASVTTHPDAFDAFARLSQPARWYFNIKRGLRGDAPAENAHRSRDLFKGLPAADLAALNDGFGRGVAEHFEQTLKAEFEWDTEALNEAAVGLSQLMRML